MIAMTLASLMAVGSAGASEASSTFAQPDWHLVYANARDGQTLAGDKCSLREAIRQGRPLRIYWAAGRVEHTADVVFSTIFGDEVFAQVPRIRGQRPSRSEAEPAIELAEPGVEWTAIIDTTGTFDTRWFAFADPAALRDACSTPQADNSDR